MAQQNQFYCNSGFLPSVKLKILSKSSGKRDIERKKIIKEKLSINQSSQQKKNVAQLIQDYYKRFKLQPEKVCPLSVSINFKTIPHEQIQRLSIKNKEQKIRMGTISNKNRSYSEGSYNTKFHIKKSQSEKNNFVARNILKKMKMISYLQQNNSNQLDSPVKYSRSQNQEIKTRILPQMMRSQISMNNHLNEQENISYEQQGYINKLNCPKYSDMEWMMGLKFKNLKPSQVEEQNKLSAYAMLNAKKKYRSHTKAIQQFGSTHKKLTPWLNQYMRTNTQQQALQILKQSVQLNS